MNNLHLTLTEFRNESRLLKQANSLVNSQAVRQVYVASLYSEGLEKEQLYSSKVICNRFDLITRGLSRGLLVQMFKYVEYCLRIMFFYRGKNIGMVNVHSIGLLPLGVLLKVFYKAKLVYDTHELETETDGLTGIRQKLSKFLERKLIRYADMTLVVSEHIADWYVSEYQIRRPTVVLNSPHRRELKGNNHFREQLGIRDDQIILLYQGGLGVGRGVPLILEAMKARTDDGLVAVFMGYGELEAEIKALALQHSNIYFFPAVAPQVVLEYTSSADVGIHLIQNTCLNHDYCMPNKLFEYAMAGLPLLVSDMKEMSELVNAHSMGAVIRDFSPAGINLALDEFLQKDLMHMKANAYHVAVENAWEVQEQKMLKAYQGLWQ